MRIRTNLLSTFINNKRFLELILALNFLVLVYFLIFYKKLLTLKRFPIDSYSNFSNKISIEEKNNIKFSNEFNQFEFLNKHNNTSNNKFLLNATKILLITDSYSSNNTVELISLFESLRYNYKILLESNLKRNIKKVFKKNIFSLIVIDSSELFQNNEHSYIKQEIFNFSSYFKLGLIIFFKSGKLKEKITINQIIDIQSKPNYSIDSCKLGDFNKLHDFFRITKFNNEDILNESFRHTDSTNLVSFANYDINCYVPIVSCSTRGINSEFILKTNELSCGYQRTVLIGIDVNHLIISSSLLIDFISYASNGLLSVDPIRYLQVDIDDIFVGAKNTRMVPSDVHALINFQENFLNKFHFNSSSYKFKFNLGFSGYYYQSGNFNENKGDELLIKKRDVFNWFDHSWTHTQPHILNSSALKEILYYNYNFALENHLNTDSFYSVSPHHSGIYPVEENLYKAWKNIWLIKATSTEAYPHLKPFYFRRGFIHDGILVMPRSTCGIFTHTIFFKNYPNGLDRLESMINGGEIFKTVLFNQVLVFMTHMTNYANDRLALFVFENLFKFLNKWTHLKFIAMPPLKLAEKYFELYPKDVEPLWTNMCLDKRHMSIWTLNSTYCNRFPKFIIIGPQKTGTTALYTFLNIHPELKPNIMLKDSFEETQFFLDSNYNKGVDWYLKLFEEPLNSKKVIYFEKSANYFSNVKAPIRIKKLIEDVKLIFITIDPIDRAYSWYQHMKYHNDSIATKYSFYDILTLNEINQTILTDMKRLRDRCLDPGIYVKHLNKWLSVFSRKQIYAVDGDELKYEPVKCMNKLQKFLPIEQFIDYGNMLKFDAKKNFFCAYYKLHKRVKCLGSSKGRKYIKLDSKSRSYLNDFFNRTNILFYQLLKKYSFQIPKWLNVKRL